MTEKRFETNMRLVIDTEKKYGARVLNAEEVVDKLNELNDENQRLKEALLFFVDVAASESSNWKKNMENACQRLFNCSYEEAKEKYDNFDSMWWELGL